ncbi:hypothetical protein FPZ41_34050 [Streptomyces sp. K1PN6]|uniref:Uncharacterized protein n=1 Tax=Streptomyces acidicola TaxID=2596892 RepID=A0A5N8X2M1_9ACTN|nr:hypothetical protein [Streptomyces acidicola]
MQGSPWCATRPNRPTSGTKARPAKRPPRYQYARRTHIVQHTELRAPGTKDRTRTVRDAVFGGLRAGCGQGDAATKVIAGQRA